MGGGSSPLNHTEGTVAVWATGRAAEARLRPGGRAHHVMGLTRSGVNAPANRSGGRPVVVGLKRSDFGRAVAPPAAPRLMSPL